MSEQTVLWEVVARWGHDKWGVRVLARTPVSALRQAAKRLQEAGHNPWHCTGVEMHHASAVQFNADPTAVYKVR